MSMSIHLSMLCKLYPIIVNQPVSQLVCFICCFIAVCVWLSPTGLGCTPRGTVGRDTRGTESASAAHLTSGSAQPSLFRTCREQCDNSPALRRSTVIIEHIGDLIMIGLELTRLNQISSTPTTRASRSARLCIGRVMPIVAKSASVRPNLARRSFGGGVSVVLSGRSVSALSAQVPRRFPLLEGGSLESPASAALSPRSGFVRTVLVDCSVAVLFVYIEHPNQRRCSTFRLCCLFFNCSVLLAALLAPLPISAPALVRGGAVPCMRST